MFFSWAHGETQKEGDAMKISPFGLFVLVAGLGASSALAQDTASTPKPKSQYRTVTGCLQKGDGEGEYRLTGKDGSTWEVRSTKVTLADHVGHSVSARGIVSHPKMHNLKEDAKDAAVDSGVKKSDKEHGHLNVTSLKMVGTSCGG
jgi:hypothetical protein